MQTVSVVALGLDSCKPAWISRLIQALQSHCEINVKLSKRMPELLSAVPKTSSVTACLFRSLLQHPSLTPVMYIHAGILWSLVLTAGLTVSPSLTALHDVHHVYSRIPSCPPLTQVQPTIPPAHLVIQLLPKQKQSSS